MKFLILILLIFNTSILVSQTPQLEWVKSFGGSEIDYPAKIIEMDDGNYLLVGGTHSKDFDITQNKGNYDIWLMKLDKKGNLLWQKTFGGSDDDSPIGLRKTLDGNYIIGGSTRSKDGDVLENKGLDDVFLWKLDPNGNILWKKYFGGSLDDNLESLSQAANGDLLLSISSQSNDLDFPQNYGGYDSWIIRLAPSGDLKWKKHYGGSDFDYINNTIEVDNNNLLSFGIMGSDDHDFKNLEFDFLIKLDSSGNELWKISQNSLDKPFGLAGLWSLVYNKEGSYLGVGNAMAFNNPPNHLGRDMIVSKFNLKGDILWQKVLGGEGLDFAQEIIQTNDGNYMIIGTQGSDKGDVNCRIGLLDAWLVKIDSSGNILWQTCLGGSENDRNDAGGLILTHDNSLLTLILHASKDGIFSKMNGAFDIGVVKFNFLTSIANNAVNENITISPNPSVGVLKIVSPNSVLPIEMHIYNMQGMDVYTRVIKMGSEEVDISGLNNGIYLASFIKDVKNLSTVKIVVMK